VCSQPNALLTDGASGGDIDVPRWEFEEVAPEPRLSALPLFADLLFVQQREVGSLTVAQSAHMLSVVHRTTLISRSQTKSLAVSRGFFGVGSKMLKKRRPGAKTARKYSGSSL